MSTVIDLLSQKFEKAIQKAFPDLESLEGVLEVTRSTQEKFGHYQCNSAMRLTKALRQNPRAIAEKIIGGLELENASGTPMIAETSIAGPGFINITLDQSYLSQRVQEIIHDDRLGVPKPSQVQRIIIDFSSPNTAKEMHVGHLRSTIIGDCLARLFEFLGHDVLRLNHIGDWGTAFGMLIAHLKETHPEILSGEQDTDLTHLVQWYKDAKKRFDDDAEFKKRSQLEVVALQGGEDDARRAWEVICEISRKGYQEIYDILDIKLIERGESFYNPYLADTVSDLEEKGLVEHSQGAKCVFLDGFKNRDGDPLPMIIQKSDGGYNYSTTDMATIKHRVDEEKADRIIYVTDAGQAVHFKMIFQLAEKASFVDPEKVRLDHVTFGLVLGGDGKKFKTRSGDTERLIDLLTAAVDKSKAILDERNPDMPEEDKLALAQVLGIGAVKYADLSCHRTGDYVFSYDRMLRFEGNTAAFLMYAYVRVAGIKRKVGIAISDIPSDTKIALEHPSELTLGLHLIQFPELLDKMSNDLCPNRLTDYLYELAEKFNAFFRDCRVEGVPEQNRRLLLCETVANTLHRGLTILGLRVVDRM